MSDTPRTDAHVLVERPEEMWTGGDGYKYERVLAKFARELERENMSMHLALCKLDALMDYNSNWPPCACFKDPSAMNKAMQEAASALSLSARQPVSPSANAAPQGQEVCQHARLPNDRVPEPAVAALVHGVCRRIRDTCLRCQPEEPNDKYGPVTRGCYAMAEEICQFVNEQRGVMDGQALLTGADEGSIPSVARPFDPNVRLYAALNLLEQVYDEMQLQGWAMDGQWATATKKVLDEHGWNA